MTREVEPGGTDPPDTELHVYREARCLGCGAYQDEDAIDAVGRCGSCRHIAEHRAAEANHAETTRRIKAHWRAYFDRQRAAREYRRQVRLARRRELYRRRRDRERAAKGLPPAPIRTRKPKSQAS